MIYLHDSLTDKKQPLKKTSKSIRLFVCGPTVYGDIHLGNASTYLIFDSLVKYLRSRGLKINYLQNITDIDDKIIAKAQITKTSSRAVAQKYLKIYKQNLKSLRINSVDRYIKASSVLSEIKDQISRLIRKGYAYKTSSGVYFSVHKFSAYGRLSRQSLKELRSGYRIEPDKEKRDDIDFVLWKKQKSKSEPAWPSPWGPGRPGWHIEDTAIAEKYFGLSYELHGGGLDLKFPHHEAEIAEAESLSRKPFVKIWLHSGMLLLNGEKMSKSLGNIINTSTFLEKYNGDVLRFLNLSRHYRSPFALKDESISQAINSLLSIKTFLASLSLTFESFPVRKIIKQNLKKFETNFISFLDDDFNTPLALAEVFLLLKDINSLPPFSTKESTLIKTVLTKNLTSLGLTFKSDSTPSSIKKLIKQREGFRAEHDFKAADKLRQIIAKKGFIINDTDQGPLVIFNNFIHAHN